MKRTLMAFMVAGALIVTVGTLSLATSAKGSKGEEIPSQQVVMRSPSEKDTVQASRDDGGDINVTVPMENTDPDGREVSGDNPVQAGGLRGGVVLSTDPMLSGGKGGIFGDCASECTVLAGGLRGGVVLNTDPVLAGDVSSNTLLAGGRGGIFGDC